MAVGVAADVLVGAGVSVGVIVGVGAGVSVRRGVKVGVGGEVGLAADEVGASEASLAASESGETEVRLCWVSGVAARETSVTGSADSPAIATARGVDVRVGSGVRVRVGRRVMATIGSVGSLNPIPIKAHTTMASGRITSAATANNDKKVQPVLFRFLLAGGPDTRCLIPL